MYTNRKGCLSLGGSIAGFWTALTGRKSERDRHKDGGLGLDRFLLSTCAKIEGLVYMYLL